MEHCNTWEIEANASIFSSMFANGRGYEIVAEYEAKNYPPHKTTYEPQPYNFALQPLCFIAFVSNWHWLKVKI